MKVLRFSVLVLTIGAFFSPAFFVNNPSFFSYGLSPMASLRSPEIEALDSYVAERKNHLSNLGKHDDSPTSETMRIADENSFDKIIIDDAQSHEDSLESVTVDYTVTSVEKHGSTTTVFADIAVAWTTKSQDGSSIDSGMADKYALDLKEIDGATQVVSQRVIEPHKD